MPGLFGIFAKNEPIDADQLSAMARRMAVAMQTQPWLKAELSGDGSHYGGRVHLGVLNPEPQPLTQENQFRMWFDGEIYPAAEEKGRSATSGEIASWADGAKNVLAETDGVFAFACYDPGSRSLFLGNDRFGFRPLYYTETSRWFAYAAEVKALLCLLDGVPALDEIALRQFFCFDHMFGERTWWRGIELLPPGSLWKVSKRGICKRRYWSFADLCQDFQPVDDVLVEFKRLWHKAVRQRLKPAPTRVLLSGGLDSRLLLAELCNQGAEVSGLTFGTEGCPDIRIARECAAIAGVPHLVRHITQDNWWDGREEAIWQADGLMSAAHFHEAVVRHDLHAGSCITQKSNVGDAILHGKHADLNLLDDWQAHPEKLMKGRMFPSPFFNADDVLACSVQDSRNYVGGATVDGFFLSQNTRRLNLAGNLLLAPYCEVLLPRSSFPLLSLLLSAISPEERRGGKFYLRFLTENYPKYFGNIPWQSNGRGVKESELVRWVRDLRDHGKRRMLNWSPRVPGVWRFANKLRPLYQYFVDYHDLLQRSRMTERLLAQDLVCDEILDGKARTVLKAPPAHPRHFVQTVMAILTFEIYLRQVQGLPAFGQQPA